MALNIKMKSLSLEERVFLISAYYKNGSTTTAALDAWKAKKGTLTTLAPSKLTISQLVRKFEKTGNVAEKQKPPRKVWTWVRKGSRGCTYSDEDDWNMMDDSFSKPADVDPPKADLPKTNIPKAKQPKANPSKCSFISVPIGADLKPDLSRPAVITNLDYTATGIRIEEQTLKY